jgi:hypothetical protein
MLTADPILTKSSTEQVLPNLTKPRKDKEDPNPACCSTEKDPEKSVILVAEILEPARTKLRSETVEAIGKKENTLSAAPIFIPVLSEKLLPTWTKSRTDKRLDNVPDAKADTPVSTRRKARTDRTDAHAKLPSTLNVLPKLTVSRRLSDDPKAT